MVLPLQSEMDIFMEFEQAVVPNQGLGTGDTRRALPLRRVPPFLS